MFQGSLYYEIAGQGQSLLLIHAGVADCQMWDHQMLHFARYFRVVRYDARGFGRSRSQSVPFSNRQDIIELLDTLGIQKTAIVGLSRGGQIAVDIAVEHPERVTALVIAAAGVSGYEDGNPTPLPLDPPALGRLCLIKIPTLVLAGELDTTAVLRVAQQLTQNIPTARQVMFPYAAHMLNLEAPARFNLEVLGFLSQSVS